MHEFNNNWLKLRETVDKKSRNLKIVQLINKRFNNNQPVSIIDLGTGEYALIGLHHSIDTFVDIMNRDNRVSDMLREFVDPYEDGESFHSFSGPVVNYNDYL